MNPTGIRMTGLVRAQHQAAITDGLTGLRSRRYLRAEAARAARSGADLGMLLLDVDHFKRVNDAYGHNGGDRVLVEVSHRISQLVRPGDLVARYGGEEFAILLPATDPEQARVIAERVRALCAAKNAGPADVPAVPVSCPRCRPPPSAEPVSRPE